MILGRKQFLIKFRIKTSRFVQNNKRLFFRSKCQKAKSLILRKELNAVVPPTPIRSVACSKRNLMSLIKYLFEQKKYLKKILNKKNIYSDNS